MRSEDEITFNFEESLRPEIDRLYRLAYRLTGEVADAQDLVQEVLVKVFERQSELSSIEVLGPWLARVLYNQFVDNTRRYRRKRLKAVSIDHAENATASPLTSLDLGPAELAEREGNIIKLKSALAKLSLEHRSVVLMHDAEGYKLNEIQQITGVSVGTLKSRLHRARARLRELVAEMEPFRPK